MKKLIILCLIPLLNVGCVTRTIKRPVEVAGQLAYEKHTIRMWVVDSRTAKVDAELKDGEYSYKVGATDLEFLSDEQFVDKLGGAIGKAIKEASF